MLKNATYLVATTALTMLSSTAFAAAAPANYPAAALNGSGATSIGPILTQELNCLGGTNSPLGISTTDPVDNRTQAIPDFTYSPVKVTTANPTYNCATQSYQPNITGKYVQTGSGGGKTSWAKGDASGIPSNPFGAWSYVSFVFSDSAVDQTDSQARPRDFDTYNANAKPKGGAAIQLPMYLLPVAIAYSPVYGKKNNGAGIDELVFNIKFPHTDGSAGGLRLSTKTLCGILNGTITNWNDPLLTKDNGGQSLKAAADDQTRWNTDGVQIKLVGRKDGSGTTNVMSRRLGAVCGAFTSTDYGRAYTNNFPNGNDALPASVSGTAAYDEETGALVSGTETLGKFGKVNLSSGVAHALDVEIPAPANAGEYAFNGRLGYVGADWVQPSELSGSDLASADLEQGKKFLAPTAANATLAYKGILPPRSDTKGKYTASPAAGSLPGSRTDPKAWVLPTTSAGNPLANATAGYPMTGTTNVLLYTCYKNPAVRKAVELLMLEHLGKITTNSTNAKVPAQLASSTAKGSDGKPLGIIPKNGLAPMPAQWATAILETFLTNTTTGNNPGALNLWIQDKAPKTGADLDAAKANPTCTADIGGTSAGIYPGIGSATGE